MVERKDRRSSNRSVGSEEKIQHVRSYGDSWYSNFNFTQSRHPIEAIQARWWRFRPRSAIALCYFKLSSFRHYITYAVVAPRARRPTAAALKNTISIETKGFLVPIWGVNYENRICWSIKLKLWEKRTLTKSMPSTYRRCMTCFSAQ